MNRLQTEECDRDGAEESINAASGGADGSSAPAAGEDSFCRRRFTEFTELRFKLQLKEQTSL